MKKLFLIVTLFVSTLTFSQALRNSNSYIAYLYDSDDKETTMVFTVTSDGIINISGWNLNGYEKKTLHRENISNMTWINNGGVWTEYQSYTFTKNPDTGDIEIFLLRVVQNVGQEPWATAKHGYAYIK